MALIKRKKKKIRSAPRVGLNAVPFDKGFDYTLNYFHLEIDRNDVMAVLKTYIKNNFTKTQVSQALANPDWKFKTYSHISCVAYWFNTKQEIHCKKHDEKSINSYVNGLTRYCNKLIEEGIPLLKEKKLKAIENKNIISLSPQQRLQNKISDTIMQDLLELEDEWIEDKETSLNVYNRFKYHGLGGSATLPVRTVIEGWLLDYEDAYHKRCEQAVEGYSHLKRSELNRRIKECNNMLLDLDRIKSATKALRKVKIKRPMSADKQVSKLKYKKEDNDFKLVSINPVQIIGASLLYTFNTKYKVLTEFVTESPNGFQISGSTIKHFDAENSRSIKVRKPESILSVVMSKTQNQIDKEWKTLTTKTTSANGRINNETILLRVK